MGWGWWGIYINKVTGVWLCRCLLHWCSLYLTYILLFIYLILNKNNFKDLPTKNPPQPSSELETLVDQLSPTEPCPQDTAHAPQEPYLGRVECCDDPHTVCVVVILNGEIGGSDDARGASKVGIAHAGCRGKMKVSFRLGPVPIPTSHPRPEETEVCTVSTQV